MIFNKFILTTQSLQGLWDGEKIDFFNFLIVKFTILS